ncbi:MAG: DNA topoisomerase VI subunit B, partial [Phycisphaerales bacterium]|nr:DNA topoisomerase VI subunit B [Phycisphaerales bacterium]
RGQQGIGISAAGMYGLMTTGQPVQIISKTSRRKPAHEVRLRMDTARNRAEVISDKEHPADDAFFPEGHGTQVTIEMEGRYQKGRQSVDEYLEQTAIANPHARITYRLPTNELVEYPRAVEELPPEAREIKPHPKGIELGTLIQMLERTERKQLGAFFKEEFCRVGPRVAKEICSKADLTDRTWVKQIGHEEADRIYRAIQDVKIMAPPTDCLVPIGSQAMLAGLLKEVKAEFFAASSRPAAVYRGNPFAIEVGLAYGGDLAGDDVGRVLRFANRVPLLYQQSACASFKAVLETGWKNYGLQQSRGSLPSGPLVVMIHMASVWVPFTSESKEAIADYDEIRKEMKLALKECGRKLGTYLRRRQRMRRESERRSVFERYIGEISKACEGITGTRAEKVRDALEELARKKTAEADQELDDQGQIVDDGGRLRSDENVIILGGDEELEGVANPDDEPSLFNQPGSPGEGTRRKKKTGKKTKKTSKAAKKPVRKAGAVKKKKVRKRVRTSG